MGHQISLSSAGAYAGLVLIGIGGGLGNAVLQVGLSFERALARSSRYVLFTLIKGSLALGLSVVLVVGYRSFKFGFWKARDEGTLGHAMSGWRR